MPIEAPLGPDPAKPTACPYETELRGWRQVETNDGDSLERALSPGIAAGIDAIAVCRNGSAVFLRGSAPGGERAVRFVRANQDSFHALLGERFALETLVSFRGEATPPVVTFSEAGEVTMAWEGRSATIVGERELYGPRGD